MQVLKSDDWKQKKIYAILSKMKIDCSKYETFFNKILGKIKQQSKYNSFFFCSYNSKGAILMKRVYAYERIFNLLTEDFLEKNKEDLLDDDYRNILIEKINRSIDNLFEADRKFEQDQYSSHPTLEMVLDKRNELSEFILNNHTFLDNFLSDLKNLETIDSVLKEKSFNEKLKGTANEIFGPEPLFDLPKKKIAEQEIQQDNGKNQSPISEEHEVNDHE